MSYYTKVELISQHADDQETSLDGVDARLDELGLSHDVIEDLEQLFATGKASVKVYASHIEAIMEWVSQQHPAVRYVVRGRGEDEDEWSTHAYVDGIKSDVEEAAKDVKRPTKVARAAIAAVAQIGDAKRYSPQARYVVGEALDHPSFGKGLVSQVQPTKVSVQFADGERILVHGRS